HCFLGNIFVSSLVAPSTTPLVINIFVANSHSHSQLPPILSSTLTDIISIRPALEDRCQTASVGCQIPAILMRISGAYTRSTT
ncbi:hypothetical protein B0H11DRAFT_2048455, partial [Mycena galericulata]